MNVKAKMKQRRKQQIRKSINHARREAGKERLVFMAMPHYGNHLHVTTACSVFLRATGDDSATRLQPWDFGRSLLANNFNSLFSIAAGTNATHFAMLHADIGTPMDGWLDVLIDELEKHDAAVMSAVVAIKNRSGELSTAVDTDYWQPTRLHQTILANIPETFRGSDLPKPGGGFYEDSQLLVNTGMWVCDLRNPIFHEHDEDTNELLAFFEICDRVVYSPEEKCRKPQVAPEDWNFSRKVASLGGLVMATSKVPTIHYGEHGYEVNPHLLAPHMLAEDMAATDDEGRINLAARQLACLGYADAARIMLGMPKPGGNR